MLERWHSCMSRPSQHAKSKAAQFVAIVMGPRPAFGHLASVNLGFRTKVSCERAGDRVTSPSGVHVHQHIKQSTHHQHSVWGGSQAMGWYFSSSTGSGRSAQSSVTCLYSEILRKYRDETSNLCRASCRGRSDSSGRTVRNCCHHILG